MALSGSRLTSALYTDLLAQMLALFPVSGSLTADEQALAQEGREKIAHAIANAAGPDVVSEITGHAVVPTGIGGAVTSGAGVGGATITNTTGTVT